MVAVKKINSKKTDVHKPKSKKADKIGKESPDGVKRLPTGNCYSVIQENTNKVLAVMPDDKYAPRVTGVFNVYLAEPKEGETVEDLNSAWYYNEKKRALMSRKFPSKALFEGFNHNLCIWKYSGVRNQLWSFDMNNNLWFNDFSKHTLWFNSDDKGANLVTKPMS
jgi:hypothetical protein